MRIILKSNFNLNIDAMEVDGEEMTLSNLLKKLGSEHHANVEFIDPRSNEVDDFFTVTINGQEYRHLPQRLETKLNHGDEGRITVLPMGGGCD